MKARILNLVLAFTACMASAEAGLWDSFKGYFNEDQKIVQPNIKVLVSHDIPEASLEVTGQYLLINPYTGEHLSTRYIGKNKKIQGLNDGLKWGENFPGLYQLKIVPKTADTTVLLDGNEYMGSVSIYDINGKSISIVNEIPVESYVRSILVQYQAKHLKEETLYALAIIARTNAYFQAVNPQNTYWAVDAERVGFKGIVPTSSEVNEAVENTRYMILSRTGVYEKVITPFPAQFDGLSLGLSTREGVMGKITLQEANEMAEKGEHAAQILAKAYPGTTVMLMSYNQGSLMGR